jgi:hypothetical protein
VQFSQQEANSEKNIITLDEDNYGLNEKLMPSSEINICPLSAHLFLGDQV